MAFGLFTAVGYTPEKQASMISIGFVSEGILKDQKSTTVQHTLRVVKPVQESFASSQGQRWCF